MSNTNWPNHITITNSKRDPKPRTEGSWWMECPTHKALGDRARELFPNATCNDTFSGVLYLAAEKHGIL